MPRQVISVIATMQRESTQNFGHPDIEQFNHTIMGVNHANEEVRVPFDFLSPASSPQAGAKPLALLGLSRLAMWRLRFGPTIDAEGNVGASWTTCEP